MGILEISLSQNLGITHLPATGASLEIAKVEEQRAASALTNRIEERILKKLDSKKKN